MIRPEPTPGSRPDPENPERWMRLAIAEAERGRGRTHPNPVVGAVVVRGAGVVGRGHTAPVGGPHAEVVALADAGERARGADLYTTLEPCDHHGRTPPCTRAILDAGVARVIAASKDPNPLVDGRGLATLRAAGVEVWTSVCASEAAPLNRPFFKAMRTGLPWVTLKAAVSLDGKMAAASGDSRWVSGEAAREDVHRLRDRVDAVLVGSGTVRQDDPALTTRLPGGGGRDPLRVVLDSALQLSPGSRIFQQRSEAPTVAVHASGLGGEREAALAATGAEVWSVPGAPGHVDPEVTLRRLAGRGALHVLVEGGAKVFASLVARGLADELWLYVAPRLVGGEGLSWLGSLGLELLGASPTLSIEEVSRFGGDIRIRALFSR